MIGGLLGVTTKFGQFGVRFLVFYRERIGGNYPTVFAMKANLSIQSAPNRRSRHAEAIVHAETKRGAVLCPPKRS